MLWVGERGIPDPTKQPDRKEREADKGEDDDGSEVEEPDANENAEAKET